MTYSSDFLANEDSARNLVLDAGYSSAAAINAATKLAELCIYVGLIRKMANEHVKGENLPSHFEAEISLKPIKLRGSTTVDLLQNLEEGNVLVPRGAKYRVMLSNMMNRVFTITSETPDSIRKDVEKLHDTEKFLDALDTIEWELVSGIHENIDLKYLDIPALEANQSPSDLIQLTETANSFASKMNEREIDLDETSQDLRKQMTKGSDGKENMQTLTEYLATVKRLSEVLAAEGTQRWKVLGGASSYPRSLLNRSGPPLIKSSWILKPEFRSHPLVSKFQALFSSNHDAITKIIKTYDKHISEINEKINILPKEVSLITLLREKNDSLPEPEVVTEYWDVIDKHCAGLKVQSKLLAKLVSNMDSLFERKE